MPVRNKTVWSPPSGRGYINPSTNADILTQSNKILLTQAQVALIINPDVYQPLFKTAWTQATKGKTSWTPGSGAGYVVTIGNELFITNSGSLIITNSGNQLVTNPTYNIPKYITQWTPSGA